MADQQENTLTFDHKGTVISKTGAIFPNPSRVIELLFGMVEELGTTLGTAADTNFKRFCGRTHIMQSILRDLKATCSKKTGCTISKSSGKINSRTSS